VKRLLIVLLILAAFVLGIWTGRHLHQPEPIVGEVPLLDRDYYPEVISLIKSAESTIHIVMFELFFYPDYPDSKTNLLLAELVNAQSRGVDVRVCLEGGEEFLGEDFVEKQLRGYRYLEKHGVGVRVDPEGVTSHAKLLVVDGNRVVVGSTNWSYYALDRNAETNVLIRSAALASRFDDYFDKLWKRSSSLELEGPSEGSHPYEGESDITKLLRNPDGWDGKRMKVSGEVVDLEKKRSRSGNLYSTFSLSDDVGNWIKVFKWGHPEIENGDWIEAEGIFRREKRVGKYTFYNELEADLISRR
jgi:hypothetical protein